MKGSMLKMYLCPKTGKRYSAKEWLAMTPKKRATLKLKRKAKSDCSHCKGHGIIVYTAGDHTRSDECGCAQK